jgi:hypothetical protein
MLAGEQALSRSASGWLTIPRKGLTKQYLIQLTAHAAINICYVVMLLHVSAPKGHLQGDNLEGLDLKYKCVYIIDNI